MSDLFRLFTAWNETKAVHQNVTKLLTATLSLRKAHERAMAEALGFLHHHTALSCTTCVFFLIMGSLKRLSLIVHLFWIGSVRKCWINAEKCMCVCAPYLYIIFISDGTFGFLNQLSAKWTNLFSSQIYQSRKRSLNERTNHSGLKTQEMNYSLLFPSQTA